ncbi:hypothetical protein FOA52_010375 [Chlamydomonas sp. UWO 241]|nr:hypothetical protein FOA52_010375 [Chlamydomonas sp. UWO 241]
MTTLSSMHPWRAANIPPDDIWFLISKRPGLLTAADTLQRWVDFLGVYGVHDKDLTNFLLRAPGKLLDGVTIYQAGQTINFLKGLGMKDDWLSQRVFAVWPAVLGRDLESELRPVVSFLTALGLEVADIRNMIGLWPELLLCSAREQLEPFAAYLRGLGCCTAQLVQVLTLCPHLLGFKPEQLFGHRLATLEAIGVGPTDVRAMVNVSLVWLTASGGVQPQVDFLLNDVGCTPDQARAIVVACPDVLAQRDVDLQRTWHYLNAELGLDVDLRGMNAGLRLVLACPRVLAASLMATLGPRHSFLQAKGMAWPHHPWQQWLELSADDGPGGASTQVKGEEQTPPARVNLPADAEPTLLLMHSLVSLGDEDWCRSVGVSYSEFREHAVHFTSDYTERERKDVAMEFQNEMQKLGIWEGGA